MLTKNIEELNITEGVLMAAAVSGTAVIIDGVRYKVEMQLDGEIIRKDGTVEKI